MKACTGPQQFVAVVSGAQIPMGSSCIAGDCRGAVVPLRVNADAALRLFFFPHAGGSARWFRAWPKRLPVNVACYGIQLPGRGERLREPPLTSLGMVIDNLTIEMQPWLRAPFGFFGHSMGALIAFELTRRLQALRAPTPMHLFVSGRGAPHLTSTRQRLYDLPDDELVEELARLGGVPDFVRAHAELMRMIIPTLRADLSVVQTHVFAPGPRLGCPITALGGTRDADVPVDHIAAWHDYTTRVFGMHMIDGDHFFVDTAVTRVCAILAEMLSHAVHTPA